MPQARSTTKSAARSGNPARRASATPGTPGVTSVKDFKSKTGGLLPLPSGAVIKVQQRGGMQAFIRAGVIPNSLMSIIQDAIDKGSKPDMSAVVTDDGVDPEMLDDMLELTDNIMIHVSVDPVIHRVPEDEEDRDENLLYVDEIDETDKMFVFQWATGGTRDLDRFREELAAGVADLGSSQVMARPAKRTARAPRR